MTVAVGGRGVKMTVERGHLNLEIHVLVDHTPLGPQ
jgi:hypothetical protein